VYRKYDAPSTELVYCAAKQIYRQGPCGGPPLQPASETLLKGMVKRSTGSTSFGRTRAVGFRSAEGRSLSVDIKAAPFQIRRQLFLGRPRVNRSRVERLVSEQAG
jgi:hypothetical protein